MPPRSLQEVAGVTFAPDAQADQGNTKTFPVAFTISANGTFVGQTNYMLDGGNNVDEYTNVNAPFPMPDAVQEFSVADQQLQRRVRPERRRRGQHHHQERNQPVSRRPVRICPQPRLQRRQLLLSCVNGVKTVDPLKRNQFGGTVGGPVSIPHLFHSDKSFFFFGYQKTINHEVAVSSTAATLPTTAQLAGTFAHEKACLHNPLMPSAILSCTQTGSTFATTVNTAAYSPVSLALFKYLPSPSELNANGSISFQKPSFRSRRDHCTIRSGADSKRQADRPLLLRRLFARRRAQPERSAHLRRRRPESTITTR